MQKKTRKQYTADFKAKVVKEMLREEKTVGQLAAEYEVHSNMLYRWREQMVAGLPGLFSDQAAQELADNLVDWEQRELPVSTQAELRTLNRSGLYYEPVLPSPEEVACKHRSDEIHTAHCYYGSRRIAAQLHREGQPINQKTVARYMQEMGLAAVYPGPNLSKRARQAAIFPYLLANVTASTPNHIWGIDIRRVGGYGIPVRNRRGREN